MRNRQDPEHWRYRYEKKPEYDRLHKLGLIGDDTYLLSLEIAGYAPKEAATELSLLKMSK